MKYYPRVIGKILIEASKQFRGVVLTGARQTGKSTLLRHLFGKTHQYVTLDNPRDLKLAQEDPELFFQQYSSPLIIDEIQYAPELLPLIKMSMDQSSKRGQFIITGSQKFSLIKGLQESLAGRVALFQLLPMAVMEGPKLTQDITRRQLSGSYPELLTVKAINTDHWFGSYLTTYIEKDVQAHYQVEKADLFRDFLFLLASRCGQVLNKQSLANDLGVAQSTITSWIKILEASQLIYLLKPYYVNLGSRMTKSPKVYFTDVGLVSYMTGIKDKTTLLRGPQAGAIFENFIIQEIIKYFVNQGVVPPLYYYRTNNGLEVDLMIEQGNQTLRPCEIKLSKTPHKGMLNNIERFVELSSAKKVNILDPCVIASVEHPFFLSEKIQAMNINDFLVKLNKVN